MSRVTAWPRRLPLKVQLVAGFSATMLVVLLAAGLFVYWRVQFALDRQVDDDLTETSQRLVPLVSSSGALLPSATAADRSAIYQVLTRQGLLVSGSSAAGTTPLVSPAEAGTAVEAPVRHDIGALLPIKNHPLRAYAVGLPDRGGEAAVLVVAVPRDHRDEALLELLVQLSVAGAGALVITSAVGYLLARSALRPVEAYRAQAVNVIDGATGVRLDIPDRREDEITRLGSTLNAMLDALEAAVERERDFVRDASHELRTPLTLLTARVQLALRRPRSVDEHEQILQELRTDLDRLSRLAARLLDETRPDVDGGISDVVAVARDQVRRRASSLERPEQLRWVADTSGPLSVALPEVALIQVVDNLVSNALAHGAPPVTVSAARTGSWAILRVEDSGSGMDSHLLATATLRFTRAAESRTRPGFGLGLAVVDQIVTRAGGELRLCFAGEHVSTGHAIPVPCVHGDAMTVTALVPLEPAGSDQPAEPALRPTGERVT